MLATIKLESFTFQFPIQKQAEPYSIWLWNSLR